MTDREELLALADAYEAGTVKCVASGYEEFGPAFQRERALVVTALRRLASSDGGVKVRELEWQVGVSGSFYGAKSVFGDYSVWTYHGAGRWFWQNWCRDEGEATDLEAAKAAAQADYESRIKSALVEVPAVKGEPEPVAWQFRGENGKWIPCERPSPEEWRDEPEKFRRLYLAASPEAAGMREALKTAIGHIEHMAAFITRANEDYHCGSYSFESLGEDMPGIKAALTAPGATTKSDGGGESRPANPGTGGRAPCIEQTTPATMPAQAGVAPGPSDPSSTRSERWVCAARQRGITLDPQDCDWPVCGCDPLANKVLDTIAESGFVIVPKDGAPMTDDQIKHMVDRFLMWQLPENFNPDAGISYTRPNWPESWPGPVGTNLFDAGQATAMVRHMLDGLPSSTRSEVTALADIAKERQRQRGVEGWSSAHDDAHDAGEMASAAACYALSATGLRGDDGAMLRFWPWDDHWWKPSNRRRDLIKAGALIVAEIERLDRLDQFEIRRKK